MNYTNRFWPCFYKVALLFGVASVTRTIAPAQSNDKLLADSRIGQIKLSSANPVVPQTLRLSLPFSAYSIDVSPDGKWLCCWAWFRGSELNLWISPTHQTKWRCVGRGTGIGSWHPDSSSYAFVRPVSYAKTRLAMLRVSNLKLRAIRTPFELIFRPSWSPSGAILAVCGGGKSGHQPYSIRNQPQYTHILLFTKAGKPLKAIPIDLRDSQYTSNAPSQLTWSPQSKSIAFAALGQNVDQGPISIVSIASGRQKFLQQNSFMIENAVYVKDWILYSGASTTKPIRGVFSLNPNNRKIPHYLSTGDYDSTTEIQDVLSKGASHFYIVFDKSEYESTGAKKGANELWLGSLTPYPKLLRRIARFGSAEQGSGHVATTVFSKHPPRLWILSENGKSVKMKPLE